ncbi:MAG TPA: SDR family NAD(P)-dependent oxidoreductase [Methylomirabilota bacterium]|nr:SDR family NAD(P)-dependent oxidoreductase [Methylomirabilota bacterium]
MRRAGPRPRPRSGLALVPLAALGLLAARRLRRRARRWDLRDRMVVVTGGSRGLGLLIARELVAQGARVAIAARDEDTLERTRPRAPSRWAPRGRCASRTSTARWTRTSRARCTRSWRCCPGCATAAPGAS